MRYRFLVIVLSTLIFSELQAQDSTSIINIGKAINSSFADYHPLITADESVMYFTARRDNTTGGKIDPNFNIYYEDIYFSKKIDGKWSQARNLGLPINTAGHDAATGLSPDGQSLFVYRDANIYQSKLDGEVWTNPEKLNKNINSKYKETAACFSFDGLTMYFISDRIGGQGGLDIYKSKLDKKGEWGAAQNLGSVVNSSANEEAVFMHPDGKTLYFSSQGHGSMGGYDIFSAVYNEKSKSWSRPVNIGAPINTSGDDVFFVLAANGEKGYYSSSKTGGSGEKDIYEILFLKKAIKPELTLYKGTVTNDKNEPVEADIEVTVVDSETDEVFAKTKSNKATGDFLLSLPSGHSYGITFAAEGHFFHTEQIDIPEAAPYFEMTKNIKLKKADIGESVVLENIYFDYNKETLKEESILELNKAIRFMEKNSDLSFEISGHTDNKGKWEYNMDLSERRAESVVNYFMEHGISKSRLVYAGYSFDKPIASNATKEGQQKNRRVQMMVIRNASELAERSLVFKVQVLASQNPSPLTSDKFKGLTNVKEYFHKGMYKYAVGEASTLEAARKIGEEMKAKGYEEAFPVAFFYDARVSMRTAMKLFKK
ncbi:MAG: PD40 domain-containing protein [Flavobacteriales bacterium]|nr:PD40 domain-containing protein [Flavobacteriales bacterium]